MACGGVEEGQSTPGTLRVEFETQGPFSFPNTPRFSFFSPSFFQYLLLLLGDKRKK